MSLANPAIAGILQLLGGASQGYADERKQRKQAGQKIRQMGYDQALKKDTMSHEALLKSQADIAAQNTPQAKANLAYTQAQTADVKAQTVQRGTDLEKKVRDLAKKEEDAKRKKTEAEAALKKRNDLKAAEAKSQREHNQAVGNLQSMELRYHNEDLNVEAEDIENFINKNADVLKVNGKFPDGYRKWLEGKPPARKGATDPSKAVTSSMLKDGPGGLGEEPNAAPGRVGTIEDINAKLKGGSSGPSMLGQDAPPPSMESEIAPPPSMESEIMPVGPTQTMGTTGDNSGMGTDLSGVPSVEPSGPMPPTPTPSTPAMGVEDHQGRSVLEAKYGEQAKKLMRERGITEERAYLAAMNMDGKSYTEARRLYDRAFKSNN